MIKGLLYMKKVLMTISVMTAAIMLTACSGNVDNEIRIPIYEASNSNKFSTAEVKRMDLEEKQKIAGEIGYACSDSLSLSRSGNLVSVNVTKFQELKEGDVIAVIDSSDLDYDLRKQQIMADAAYEEYQATGSEAARLNYEYEKACLEKVKYEVDSYTLRAPYDCIISDLASTSVGEEMNAGTYICSVAPTDGIFAFIRVDSNRQSPFKLGRKVDITLTGNPHEGTVVSVPKSNSYRFGLEQASYSSAGDTAIQPMRFEDKLSGPTAADSGSYAIIKFEPEVLAEILEETPNAVNAGWATIEVTTRRLRNVLAVPSSAIVTTDTTYVYLYQDGQRLMTPIITGESINGYTVVTGGITEGDKIVVG